MFLSGNIFCQKSSLRFQHIASEDGLSQEHILCMMQDSEGYIWIGTYDGLNRYNGYSFDNYFANDNDSNSLTINVVYSLFEDRDGNIWCGTWGVDIYNRITGKFSHITALKGENSISAGEVPAICQDDSGNIWLATQGGGINKVDYKTRKVSYIKAADTPQEDSLCSNFINDLLIDSTQNMWIATEGGGLSRMNLKNGKIKTYLQDKSKTGSLASNKITCLFEDDKHNIWLGETKGRLQRYDPEQDNFDSYDVWNAESQVTCTRIMQIAQDNKGQLLLATKGSGLLIFDPGEKTSEIYVHNTINPVSIASNETYSILTDKANTVFVGTFGRGISWYSQLSQKFNVYSVQKEGGFGGSDINAFTDAIEDTKGNLITGTYNGFLVWDQKTWKFRHFLPGNSYEENKVLTVKLAPDSTIWISTIKYLYRYDREYNKLQTYTFDEDLIDHSIYAIEFDYRDNLWIGQFTRGLLKISGTEWRDKTKQNLSYTLYQVDLNDSTTISGNQHWVIRQAKDSTLWIGGVGGLDRYNYKEGNFTWVFNPGSVKTIDIDSKGKIWIGTIGLGLYGYDPASESVEKYTVSDGLSQRFIYGVLADSQDNIWVTTASGLSKLDTKTHTFQNYDVRDGLPDNHFDDKSEARLSGGRFYMGTSKGFILFKPEEIRNDTSNARIVLTDLTVNNRKIEKYNTGLRDSSSAVPVDIVNRIDLDPSEKDIVFEFAALHFAAPDKIKYQYQLDGYDKNWINTDAANRIAKYTNLDKGTYTFRVKATNSDGYWMDNMLSIDLVVHPHFYQTIIFKIILTAIISFMIFLFFRWRMSQVVKQKILLEGLVDERTQELSKKNQLLQEVAKDLEESNFQLEERQQFIEEQSEELLNQRDALAVSNSTKDKLFSIIAHDLKNPFNVILGYSELLIDRMQEWDDEKKIYFLKILKESSQTAYNLLENLLQWSRSQNGTLQYNPAKTDINEAFEIVLPGVINFTRKKEIEIVTRNEAEGIHIFADINMLTTILRNLLMNAAKFSNPKENILLKASVYDQEYVIFSVIDNGIGMSQDELKKLFDLDKPYSNTGTEGEKGTGIGLILCKDFVDYHKGKIWAESKPDSGTGFYFTIPKAKQ